LEATNKVLNSRVELTVEEYLALLKPSKAGGVVTSLKNRVARKPGIHVVEPVSGRPTRPSYVVVGVDGKLTPLYVDPGAHYSLITREKCEELGKKPVSIAKTISAAVANNQLDHYTHMVTLNLLLCEDVAIPVQFLVTDSCPEPLLLGLDVMVTWGMILNYKKHYAVFDLDDDLVKLELFDWKATKKICDVPGFLANESSDSGSSSEDESASEESDEDAAASALTMLHQELRGNGGMEVDNDEELPLDYLKKETLDPEEREKIFQATAEEVVAQAEKAEGNGKSLLLKLLNQYKDVFAFYLSEISEGVNGVVFDVELVDGKHTPIAAKLNQKKGK
jgi:hypothetical protein